MSNKRQETIADIVAQIRAVAYVQTAESPSSVLQLADRIEAAAKRENDRLRAALKPVLERPAERPCFALPDCPRFLAIKEAQRIYNEGEVKQQEGAKE